MPFKGLQTSPFFLVPELQRNKNRVMYASLGESRTLLKKIHTKFGSVGEKNTFIHDCENAAPGYGIELVTRPGGPPF